MFAKFFGKKLGNAAQSAKRVENRDLMQAIVAGSLYIASSDGTIEDEEVVKLEELITSNENLSHFGSEIHDTVERFRGKFKANFQVGRLAARRELDDVKSNREEAEEVFVNMIAIAASDGEIEEAELKTLKEVAGMFGLQPSMYGIEV